MRRAAWGAPQPMIRNSKTEVRQGIVSTGIEGWSSGPCDVMRFLSADEPLLFCGLLKALGSTLPGYAYANHTFTTPYDPNYGAYFSLSAMVELCWHY